MAAISMVLNTSTIATREPHAPISSPLVKISSDGLVQATIHRNAVTRMSKRTAAAISDSPMTRKRYAPRSAFSKTT